MFQPPKLPRKLQRDTIYEAIFEMRFTAKPPATSSLLLGLLYSQLQGLFQKSEDLPVAMMPAEMRNQLGPLMLYQPVHTLTGKGIRLAIGPRVLNLGVVRPYCGWDKFKTLIGQCSGALLKTGMIADMERCSLKYTNLLCEGRDENDLRQLKVSVQLDGFDLLPTGTLIKAEIRHNDCNVIVSVAAGASVQQVGAPPAIGVLLDVDAVKDGPVGTSDKERETLFELLHTTEKEVFFSLLTETTLERLGPEW
jgi:uncharacterized protein (TIGR04255 family)